MEKGLPKPHIKMYFKTIIIKTVKYWCRKDCRIRLDKPCIHGNLTCDRINIVNQKIKQVIQ